MTNNHMKRIKAPRTWRIHRKDHVFVSRPNPGAHKLEFCLTLNTFLKELAEVTNTTKETKYLLTHMEAKVNGRRVRDEKFQVGFLDIIEIPSIKKTYLVTIDKKGKLAHKELKDVKESLFRVKGKTILSKDKVQVNGLNGVNFLSTLKDAKDYKSGDSIILEFPSKKPKTHLKMKKDAYGFVFTGKHAGKSGVVLDITDKTIKIKTKDEEFETNKKYFLVTGDKKPAIEVEM